MPTVFDVADYFLAKTEPELGDWMTHMKLQKLVYFAQGFNLALNGAPLFDETIEAWDHGPVCPTLYSRLRRHKSNPIKPVKTLAEAAKAFTRKQRAVLDDVYTAFGCFAAWYLRQISHQDTAWHNAYPKGLITLEAMKESCQARLQAA